MLKTYMARGDVIHVTFEDGKTGTIEAHARSELTIEFPQTVRLYRPRRRPKKLICPNQK